MSAGAAGRSLFERGRYRESLAWLRRAAAENPRDGDSRALLAMALRLCGRPREALRELKGPAGAGCAAGARSLTEAAALKDLGRLEESLAACGRAEAAGAAGAALFELRGDVETALGLPAEAADSLERAADIDRGPRLLEKAAAACAAAGYPAAGLSRARAALSGEPGRELSGRLARELGARLRPPPGGGARLLAAVDPRLELLGLVWALGAGSRRDAPFVLRGVDPYARLVSRRFRSMSGHPAVRLLAAARRGGLTAAGAQRSLLTLGAPPLLESGSPEEGAGRPEVLEALSSFARGSHFMRFFRSQKPRYERWARDVGEQTARLRDVERLSRYARLPARARYTLALSPLMDPGGGGGLNHVFWDGAAGEWSIVSTVGPSAGGGETRFDYAGLRWAVWHELGHVLLDDRLEPHRGLLRRTRWLLGGGSPRYRTWEQTVREHMAQGLASRLAVRAGAPRPRVDLPFLDASRWAFERHERARPRRGLGAGFAALVSAFIARAGRGVAPRPERRAAPAQRQLRDGLR